MSQPERQHARLALPHSFQPEMRFGEAVIRVIGALARIVLGSIVFAVCGAYIWYSGATIRNLFLRLAVMAGLSLIFFVVFGALMLAIHIAVEWTVRRAQRE